MHAFTGDHLIVFDAFGLTRLTLGGKSKHNKKVAGDFLVANGGLLVGHSAVSNKRFALTVPKLEVVPTGDGWHYNLKYGTSLAVAPDERIVDATDGALVLYDRGGQQRARIQPPAGRALAALDLGSKRTARWTNRIAIGPDGTYVLYADGLLLGGKLAGDTVTRPWSAPAPIPQGQIHLRAGAWGAFISVFHPARRQARCVLVGEVGAAQTATIDCLAPVDFDGARIAYQSAPGELCRAPIRGGDVERFSLPASAHGVGTVMADADRLLFVAPDRERIVDVADDDIIPRGLADAERPARRKLIAFVERFRPAADAANLDLRLGAMCPPAYGGGPRPQWAWDAGDESVLAAMVVGNLLAEGYRDPDTSAGSFSHVQTLAPVTAASVERAFAVLDDSRLGLLAGLWMLATPLADHYHPRRGGDGKPRLAKDAARMLLHAVIATHGKPEQPPLGPSAAAWANQPLDAAGILAAIDPRVSFSAGVHSDAELAVLWIAVDYLGAAAVPVLLDWLLERPSPMVEANMHVVGAPAAGLAKFFPAAAAPLRDGIAAASRSSDPARAARATSLQGTIDFELR